MSFENMSNKHTLISLHPLTVAVIGSLDPGIRKCKLTVPVCTIVPSFVPKSSDVENMSQLV